jgi:hypothetical protein
LTRGIYRSADRSRCGLRRRSNNTNSSSSAAIKANKGEISKGEINKREISKREVSKDKVNQGVSSRLAADQQGHPEAPHVHAQDDHWVANRQRRTAPPAAHSQKSLCHMAGDYLASCGSLPQHSGRLGSSELFQPPPRAWTSETASTRRRPRIFTAVISSDSAAL